MRGSIAAGAKRNCAPAALYVESGKEHGPVFDLLVPDVLAAKSRLLAAGCALIEEDPAVPRCYIRDPYGFTFNVGKAGSAV